MMSRRVFVFLAILSAWGPASLGVEPDAEQKHPEEVVSAKAWLAEEMESDAQTRCRRSSFLTNGNADQAAPEMFWASGYVRSGTDWRSYDEPHIASPDESEYFRRRAKAKSTPEAHRQLAMFAMRKKLGNREHAHWTQVLMTSQPRDEEMIYKRIGYQKFSGRWQHPDDIAATKAEHARRKAAFDNWGPRLMDWAEQLDGNAKARAAAAQELRTEVDQTAAEPLERLAQLNEYAADLVLEKLKEWKTVKSTRALSRVAILSPWAHVRRGATDVLMTRRAEDFVPEILANTYRPYETECRLVRPPANTGRRIEIILYDRCEFQGKVQQTDRIVSLVAPRRPQDKAFYTNLFGFNPFDSAERDLDSIRTTRAGDIMLDDMKYQIERHNDFRIQQTATLYSRCEVLVNRLAGKELGSDPIEWWKWWNNYTETEYVPTEEKPIELQERLVVKVVRPPSSCLPAGTAVWTEFGLRPIEKILVGDRVLSKNTETGELAYQPVLATTVRKPVPLRKMTIGDETIAASPGHNFWVSGEGWKKMRDLRSQDRMHTVTGMVRIQQMDQGEIAPVYNLIVADHHTYFVGKSMLLSHDVLLPTPTDIKVPGLTVVAK